MTNMLSNAMLVLQETALNYRTAYTEMNEPMTEL